MAKWNNSFDHIPDGWWMAWPTKKPFQVIRILIFFLPPDEYISQQKPRWWQLKEFLIFTPLLTWRRWSKFDLRIFFKWVGNQPPTRQPLSPPRPERAFWVHRSLVHPGLMVWQHVPWGPKLRVSVLICHNTLVGIGRQFKCGMTGDYMFYLQKTV